MKSKLAVILISLFLCAQGAMATETDWQGLNPNLNSGALPSGVVVVKPTASVSAGTYHASQSITLSAAGSNSIRYTVNGTEPACPSTGTLYSGAITVSAGETLKAIACYQSDNSVSSAVMSNVYIFTCVTDSVSNGSVGSYPSCGISCNAGYFLSGSSCAISGGGGGGGGGGGYIAPLVTTTASTGSSTSTVSGLNLPYSNPSTTAEITANRTALIAFILNLLQSMQGGSSTTPSTGTVNSSGIPSGFRFNTTLTQGMTNNDVKYLQVFLNSDSATSLGNAGTETTYFGALTKVGVGKFQMKYNLITGTSDSAYGIVGPKSRAKINSLLGL